MEWLTEAFQDVSELVSACECMGWILTWKVMGLQGSRVWCLPAGE